MIKLLKTTIKKCIYKSSSVLMSLFLTVRKKKYVLLVVQDPLMFHYIRPIHQILSDDPDIVLRVCFPWPEKFKKDEFNSIKETFKIRTINYKIAKYIHWCLIIFADHLPLFHPQSSKIRIEHGFYNGKLVNGNKYMFGPYARDENNEIIYDKILVSSEYVCSGIQKNYPELSSRIRAVGSILLDEIYSYTEQKIEIFNKINLDPSRQTIMIASSWGPCSFIQLYGFEFIRQLPELTKKYNVIISIHFLNLLSENSGGRDWNKLLDEVKGPNIYISPPGDQSYHLLANSDLLIMDMTSLGLYFPVFERPIIHFYDTGVEYEPLSLNNELHHSVYTSNDVDNLDEQITNAFKSFDKEKMRSLSNKIASHKGKASSRFKEEIYDSLSK
ncbi:MAG: CDP-glycerol glycerophosphotransferase family protein [Psychromonas sp.]